MRPVSLVVEGFTCFREKQEPLEFSQMSLFAIAGRTGAGKSSILDALIFALYGSVPRLGKEGVSPLISHGRDRLSVRLDFEANGRSYRIARTVKRGKAAQVKLEETTPGSEGDIAAAVREADAAVVRILGLNYEAFTQTVVLPQGEFQRFLRGKAEQRRKILSDLLRTNVFEQMRAKAEERKRDHERDLKGIASRLTDDFAGVSAERLAAVEGELEQAAVSREEMERRRQEAAAGVASIRRGHELTVQLRKARATQERLEAERPEMAARRTELEAAERAAGMEGLIRDLREKTTKAKAAVEEAAKAEKAHAAAAGKASAAAAALASAEEAAGAIPALADKVRLLDELKGDLEQRRRLEQELSQLEPRVRELEPKAAAARRALEEASGGRDRAAADLAARQAEAAAVEFDAALLSVLEPLRDDLAAARALDTEIAVMERRARDAAVAVERAASALAAAAKDCDAAAAALEAAERAHARADHAYQMGVDANRAAALRAHLHDGDECPVCLQPVSEVPAVEVPPALAQLDKALKLAAAAVTRARERDGAAREVRARAEAGRAQAEKAAADLEGEREAALARRETIEGKLRAAVPAAVALTRSAGGGAAVSPVGGVTQAGPVAAWCLAALADQSARRRRHDEAAARVREAERAEAAASHRVLEARARGERDDAALAQALERQGGARGELDTVRERIARVTDAPDPAAERARLSATIEALRQAEQRARIGADEARQAAARAEQARDGAGRSRVERVQEEAAARAALGEALAASGFETEAAVVGAVREPAVRERLRQAVQAFERDLHAAEGRVAELAAALGGAEVDDRTFEAAGEAERQAGEALTSADRRVVTLTHDVDRLKTALKKAEDLARQRVEIERRLDVAGAMAEDLRSNRFQQYLLNDAFEGLVRGASVRMQRMTERYTLAWENECFMVVDHDNAGERRKAETLSGGETFLASLCLALELSSQVLHASGLVQVDSLFIDEGFGTLDAETLDTVTSAIESLGRDGGRMVGVISHIDGLTDRLPGCIAIDQGQGESTWRVERFG